MTPLEAARRHLTKAQEFSAEANSACLVLVGKTAKANDHRQAVGELRKVGKIGADLAPTLDRLLKPRTKSPYQSLSMTMKDAQSAVAEALHSPSKQVYLPTGE